jgi:hypothetical protein
MPKTSRSSRLPNRSTYTDADNIIVKKNHFPILAVGHITGTCVKLVRVSGSPVGYELEAMISFFSKLPKATACIDLQSYLLMHVGK